MKTLTPLILGALALGVIVPALAFADNAQVYKWTDASGVVHYSDKPPADSVADLQTLDMPALPAQDPAAIAAGQAALLSQTAALQQLQAEAEQQQQAAALAQQRAELAAEMAAFQQAQAEQAQPADTVPLIYSTSAFVPAAYRRNLYVNHTHPQRPARSGQRASTSHTAISLYGKP